MKKRFSILTALVLCVVTAAITYVFTANTAGQYYDAKLDQAYEDMAPFTKLIEIDKYVRSNYVGEIDEDKLMTAVYDGYFTGLGDRFSMYHTKSEMDELNMTSDGKLVGVGMIVAFDIDNNCIYVRRVMPDSPAESAGIKAGDLITSIDGTEITEDTYNSAIALVKGEEGTTVKFAVKRGDSSFELDVNRATVRSTAVYLDYLDNNVAYIYITEFTGNAATDFIACMKKAQEKGVSGYIFDVRNNPGGDLEVICTILDYLLPEGPIIRVKDAAGNVQFTRDSGASCVDAPMTVLVNGDTASAAELFTAALRDYHKAAVVGTTTFGKGTMQHIITLSDGSGIRLSCYYYDPPYGENYHNKGITPDVTVELDEYYSKRPYLLNPDNDAQLKSAETELNKIIEGEK